MNLYKEDESSVVVSKKRIKHENKQENITGTRTNQKQITHRHLKSANMDA